MASKLKQYYVKKGKTEKNGRIIEWTGFYFVFIDVNGKERQITAFPRNSDMLADLLGFDESEIVRDDVVRHKD